MYIISWFVWKCDVEARLFFWVIEVLGPTCCEHPVVTSNIRQAFFVFKGGTSWSCGLCWKESCCKISFKSNLKKGDFLLSFLWFFWKNFFSEGAKNINQAKINFWNFLNFFTFYKKITRWSCGLYWRESFCKISFKSSIKKETFY